MKTFQFNLILLFVSLFGANVCLSQTPQDFNLKFNEGFKLGETEDFSFHVSSLRQDENIGESLTYVRIPLNGGPVEVFEQDKVKLNGLSGILTNGVVRDGRIFEHYLAFKPGIAITKKSAFIVERSPKTLEIIGKPLLLAEYRMVSKMQIDGGGICADDQGFFVAGVESIGSKDKLFLKRYDFDLKLLWTKDISSLNSKNEYKITKMTFDEKDRSVLFDVNLLECEDCGMFKAKKGVSKSAIGIVSYDEQGNEVSFLPEIPDGTIYSVLKLFSDKTAKTITGVFQIHEIGKNEMKQANGLGFSVCVWKQETGELLNSSKQILKFKDVLGSSAQKIISLDPKLKLNIDDNFPRLMSDFSVEKLPNGDFLILFSHLKGLETDIYNNIYFNKSLAASSAFYCLTNKGELRWSTFMPIFGSYSFHYGELSSKMGYNFLCHGHSENYTSGNFELKSSNKENLVLVYGKLNLSTGEFIYRKSIKNDKFPLTYLENFQNYIEHSSAFVITTGDANLGKVKAKAMIVEVD